MHSPLKNSLPHVVRPEASAVFGWHGHVDTQTQSSL